jgi:hypothetical protein
MGYSAKEQKAYNKKYYAENKEKNRMNARENDVELFKLPTIYQTRR